MKLITRRRALLLTATSMALPLSSVGTYANASEKELVNPEDPVAKSLSYLAVSTTENQNCNNCQLYFSQEDSAVGACAIFPNNVVASEAWCSAWTKKAV
jgi:hypothetical protein